MLQMENETTLELLNAHKKNYQHYSRAVNKTISRNADFCCSDNCALLALLVQPPNNTKETHLNGFTISLFIHSVQITEVCMFFLFGLLTRRHKPQITLFECESMTNALMRSHFYRFSQQKPRK